MYLCYVIKFYTCIYVFYLSSSSTLPWSRSSRTPWSRKMKEILSVISLLLLLLLLLLLFNSHLLAVIGHIGIIREGLQNLSRLIVQVADPDELT